MTPKTQHPGPPAARQRGAVLFVSLIFLLILTLLGVMLARTETTEERLAQNDANHDIAVEAAAAALRFAEMNISEGNYVDFAQNSAGLYLLDPTQGSAYDTISNIWSATGDVLQYSGSSLYSVSAAPEFIVEQLPSVALPGASLGSCNAGYGSSGCEQVYQITAHATGGDQTGNATLRSIYEKD